MPVSCMTRREMLLMMAAAPLAEGAVRTMAGTGELTWDGDLSVRMMDGAHAFVERKIAESVAGRAKIGPPDRGRFLHMIGAVDARVPAAMERFAMEPDTPLVGETSLHKVWQVRWPVLEGVHGEGLMIEPKAASRGAVIAMGDADQTPEQVAAGEAPRRLAENGFTVIVPTLVDRGTRWSGHAEIKMTDQPHREWIYRQAYQMGRHIIGYEVQKVLAAVDWLQARGAGKIGVAGYGEGGLIAFYAAAADVRIDAALVSAYFDSRQAIWSEPIYRNLFGILREFGDAEIARMIAPRALIVEYARGPEIASPRGDLKTPSFQSVKAEFERIDASMPKQLVSEHAEEAFAAAMGVSSLRTVSAEAPKDLRKAFDPAERQHRQVKELETHVQSLIRASDGVREQFYLYKVAPELADDKWSTELRHKTFAPEKFIEASKWYRRYFHEEIMGKFDEPMAAPNARTRQIYDSPKYAGYEVALDVFPELFAWGVLLVPKDLKPGERRPVVVCQHGRQGIPQETIEGDNHYYHNFAARLAEQGFITFSPHNLYRGEDRYRWLCRKANGVKATLFSFIISQHEQILRWLKSLAMVDGKRIAFYGLSYGGETAMRVPSILEDYCLSICSGDFNSWTEKVAATDQRFSFMYTIEWEMPYFNMGETFDYAEMAYLIFPRPFMVERGHNDRVARDQWVAYQYGKVRWLYAQFGMEDRTEIEYYNGGHTINGEGTFRFLRKHLNWPPKQ